MAKKDKPKLNYGAELKRLKEQGPERLYLLCGPEDYLRERFLEELRKCCGVTEEDFGYQRLNGQSLDLNELAQAVDALPFFAERSLVEVRDYDLAKCREADCERLKALVEDIPDYCTLVFVYAADTEPDGRSAAVKAVKKAGYTMEFTQQEQGALVRWVQNRFAGLGKQIAASEAQYLIFLCGSGMSRLIPEIEKAASYAPGDTVTREHIDATADRIPEANIFTMTDLLSQRRYDAAAGLLSDLLADKRNHPIQINALIGQQMRRMYAVKVGQAAGRGRSDIMELCSLRFDFLYDKLSAAAKPFTMEQLGAFVSLCAEYDFRMKSTGQDPGLLLRELFARLAVGV